MTYEQLIEKIGQIVDESDMLLRVNSNALFIDAKEFTRSNINKLQRLLNLYGECEWWILPSDTVKGGVMYKVIILKWL